MPTPRVTVVIPCYNHGAYLGDAVQSVREAQRADTELIVVDDGSTDSETLAVLERLEAEGVRLLRQSNWGVGAARNAGIRAGSGEYIIPLDADNAIRADYLSQGIWRLDRHPRAGVAYGDAEYRGMRTGRWEVGEFDRARVMRRNYIDACAMIRRCVWEECGGYDEQMPVQGYEDWDLWLGAIKRGWRFTYIPQVVFDYRVSEESMIHEAMRHDDELVDYLAHKHGDLYRNEWLALDAKAGEAHPK